MKKIVSLILIMCILSMSALPVLAQPADDMVQPCASLSLSGGMAYVTSVGAHYIQGRAFGASESKTVTVTLYRQSGSSWIYIDSVSKTGTTTSVTAGKYVTLTLISVSRISSPLLFGSTASMKKHSFANPSLVFAVYTGMSGYLVFSFAVMAANI